MQTLHDFRSLADENLFASLWGLGGFEFDPFDVVAPFDEELEHKARHFSTVQTVAGGVVNQADLFGALQQAVEIVGEHRNLMVDGGHAESLAQIVRNKGRVSAGFGQLSFVYGKQNQVAEVQITGFEHTHHLQTDGRFAVERNAAGRHYPVD